MPPIAGAEQGPPPLVPIVVGVAGKRELSGREDYVKSRLAEMLARIEDDFKNSPLVLITGLAKGADLLAAEIALGRECWTVVGILPFSKELFLEDFEGDGDREWRRTLEAVLAAPPERFLLKVLKPLRGPAGEPYKEEDLRRAPDNPARRQHYEQLGLVVADRCGLLIAVMPQAEKPGKIGGTARIVQFKDGTLDATAREVAEASDEIAPPEPLDRVAAGLVQILDPDPGAAAVQREDPRYARMTLQRIEAFNRIVRGPSPAAPVPSAPGLLTPGAADPASRYVGRLRGQLGEVQAQAKSSLSRSMWWLAALFVASVAILEVYAKIWNLHWLYLGYAIIVLGGLLIFHRVGRQQLQAVTEDYRGATEAMRVQVEWWRLGLRGPRDRVDRYYLVGGEGHFAVLRSGIKAVLDAVGLLDRGPAPRGQPLALEPETEDGEEDAKGGWVPGQIGYFTKSSDERHRTAIRLSSFAWYLFQLSVGVGIAIGGLLLLGQPATTRAALLRVPAWAVETWPWLPFAPFAVAALWAIVFSFFARTPEQGPLPMGASVRQRLIHLLRYKSNLGARGQQHSGKRGWWAVLLGMLMVPGVLAYLVGGETPADAALATTEKVSIVLMIVLAAASGAVRFVIERRALEAEAVSYREMLQRFRAARQRAQEEWRQAGGDAAALLAAHQELGRELGRVALAESEGWLRAHRQRPFEPVT